MTVYCRSSNRRVSAPLTAVEKSADSGGMRPAKSRWRRTSRQERMTVRGETEARYSAEEDPEDPWCAAFRISAGTAETEALGGLRDYEKI